MRAVEIAVALLLFAFGATVIFDSYRLGSSWGSDGPQSGYFPFYIGLLICFSSVATLVQVLLADQRARRTEFDGAVARRGGQFVAWGPFKQVLAVLLPSIVYVLFVQVIGIYVASMVYIALFMVWLGKYSWLKSIAVGLLVMVGIFALFEIWFKVPLWKGIYDPLALIGF
ncbi:MAG: tripartite tricarboxylate transporter TctB family protein [Vicinamibacterales bacterium]